MAPKKKKKEIVYDEDDAADFIKAKLPKFSRNFIVAVLRAEQERLDEK